jgi:hypothetical protein
MEYENALLVNGPAHGHIAKVYPGQATIRAPRNMLGLSPRGLYEKPVPAVEYKLSRVERCEGWTGVIGTLPDDPREPAAILEAANRAPG